MTKKALILAGFIVLKFMLQYNLISPEYELQRDEYLHLDLGHHLAWGYLSVPPFTSWISRIIYLLGNSVFWVKFFPSLFGALTIIVVWKTIEELKKETQKIIDNFPKEKIYNYKKPKKKPYTIVKPDRAMMLDTTTNISGAAVPLQKMCGGEVRGAGAAIRGTKFKGVF